MNILLASLLSISASSMNMGDPRVEELVNAKNVSQVSWECPAVSSADGTTFDLRIVSDSRPIASTTMNFMVPSNGRVFSKKRKIDQKLQVTVTPKNADERESYFWLLEVEKQIFVVRDTGLEGFPDFRIELLHDGVWASGDCAMKDVLSERDSSK